MIFGAIILMLAISPLTALYIHPVVSKLITKSESTVEPTNESDGENYNKKLIHWTPLTMTGVVTCVGLLVIHIFSLIKIDQYGDEVVSSKSYDKIMGAIYPILSLLTVIT